MAKVKATKSKNAKSKSKRNAGKIAAGAVGVAIAAGVGGYGLGVVSNQEIQDFEPVYTVSAQELKSAKSSLSELAVRKDSGRVPDYDSNSMPDWSDVDDDGCSTRYDILYRDLMNEKSDGTECGIKSGTLFDYYTGTLVKYNRLVSGGGIDIDHIVAKGNAWISGGSDWDMEQWEAYVNDEDVLQATTAKANRSKGDKDASEWLPPNEQYWCVYVIKQIQIKDKYDLSVSVDEKAIMSDTLSSNCDED